MTGGKGVLVCAVLAAVLAVLVVSRARGDGAPDWPTVEGEWVANGLVETSNAADQPPGTRLSRRWTFYDRVIGGHRRLWLVRESADVLERAPVEADGDHLHAVFQRRTNGCGTTQTGTFTRVFDMTVSDDARSLTATERETGDFPGCGQVRSTVSWTAAE